MKWVAVCREAFINVYGIRRTRQTLLHQSYKENGLMPLIKKRSGPSKRRLHLKHEDLQRVVNFNNYAEDNAIILPGRHPGHKHFGGKLLLSHVTKAAVWCLYKESMTTLEVHVVGLSSFRNLWGDCWCGEGQHCDGTTSHCWLDWSFDALEPGVVVAKGAATVGTRFQLLRNADVLSPIDGLPVQAPPGHN
ncbi:uncharacterized protein ACWYII_038461 [Salvelinus alpinus]